MCNESSSDDHSLDLGVICTSSEDGNTLMSNTPEAYFYMYLEPVYAVMEIRLANGSNIREGRLEVLVNGHWGTVCNNSQEEIAGAVCSQLGFPAESECRIIGYKVILLTTVHCTNRFCSGVPVSSQCWSEESI